MNKWLIGFIVLALLILSGLGGYYLLILNPAKTPALIETIIPNLPGSNNTSIDWQNVKKQIAKDCKEVSFTAGQDTSYISRLGDAIGGVTIDPTDNAFTTIDDTQELSIQAVAKNGGVPVSGAVNCWTLWVGDTQGAGRVAYEASTGEIKTREVSGFPLPSPPSQPPPGE